MSTGRAEPSVPFGAAIADSDPERVLNVGNFIYATHDGGKGFEHGSNQGPVYSTTLGALMLQVYYRTLPTFKEDASKAEEVPVEAPKDDVVIEII